MALHLIRCHRILHLTGMQNNIRKRGLQSVLSCNSKSQDTKSISHRADIMRSLLNHNVSELEYSGIRRPFHSSVPLLKKFDTKDYETLRILDPAGMFLCNSELYVLKKFCQQYKRFTYDEVKPDGENTANLDVGDGRLRVFKLSDKREGKSTDSTDSKDTKTKIIKFHKEKSVEGGKADKIIELLVDQGKVNIMFDERNNIAKLVIGMVKDLIDIKVVAPPGQTLYMLTMREVNHSVLQKLLERVQEKEAKHIAQVKDLLETMKAQ